MSTIQPEDTVAYQVAVRLRSLLGMDPELTREEDKRTVTEVARLFPPGRLPLLGENGREHMARQTVMDLIGGTATSGVDPERLTGVTEERLHRLGDYLGVRFRIRVTVEDPESGEELPPGLLAPAVEDMQPRWTAADLPRPGQLGRPRRVKAGGGAVAS